MCIHSQSTRAATTNCMTSSPSSDGNVTSLKTALTVLPTSHAQDLRSESTECPDSVSVAPSQLNKTEETTEQKAIHADSERTKSTRTTSNQYGNKTKAKVHLGACSIGALTFGILAGPVGLIFAPAYLNAICMAMYGGHEFLTGGTSPHETESETITPEPEQPEASTCHTPPSPPSHDQPDELDNEEEEDTFHRNDIPKGPSLSHDKRGNFTFAPVYTPNITINEAPNITINGNLYFMQGGDETMMPSQTGSTKENVTESDRVRQELNSNKSKQLQVTRIVKMTPEQVSIAVKATTDESADLIAQTLGATGGDTRHVTFNNGAQVIVTGLPTHAPSAHHRGEGFTALNEAGLAFSQASYLNEKAKGEEVKVGETHSWHIGEGDKWLLSLKFDNLKLVDDDLQTQGTRQVTTKSVHSRERNIEHKEKGNIQQTNTLRMGGAIREETHEISTLGGRWGRKDRWEGANPKSKVENVASVILSPGSAQAISGSHGNLTAGIFNNTTSFNLKKNEKNDHIESSMFLQTEDCENTRTNTNRKRSMLDVYGDTGKEHVVSDSRKYAKSEVYSEDPATFTSRGDTQKPPYALSKPTQTVSDNFKQILKETLPRASTRTTEDVRNDAFEKVFDHSGRWVRVGSRWVSNPELKVGNEASVTLSPGSAQAIYGRHSNRSTGVFMNMSGSTLKKTENQPKSKGEQATRRLHVWGHRAFPFVNMNNLVSDVKKA